MSWVSMTVTGAGSLVFIDDIIAIDKKCQRKRNPIFYV